MITLAAPPAPTSPLTWLAVGLAALGACCFAQGARQQHRSLATAGLSTGWPPLRDPRWLAGMSLLGLGVGLHALALSLAPLTVVQPVGVLALVITAMLDSRARREPLTRRTAFAIGGCMFGVGTFVVLAASVGVSGVSPAAGDAGLVVGLLALAGTAVAACALLPGRRRRCLTWIVGAGVAFGFVAALTRVVATQVSVHGLDGLPALPILGLAAAGPLGIWCVQRAYAGGPPELVVAGLTVIDPVVAIGIGLAVLGEASSIPGGTATAMIASALCAIAGVVVLAQRRPPTGPPPVVGPHRPDGPLRIVIGADTFPPDVNGAAHFAGRLASGLAGRGHEVHVVCPATGPAPSEAGEPVCTDVMVHRLPSYPVLVHPSFRICRPWVLSRRAGDALDAVRPDVVHVQSHFLVGRALLAAARRRGLPVVATNHFMPENLLGYLKITTTQRAAVTWLAWRDLCRVYGRAHAVTAPTPRAAALLMAQGLRRRVQAISCGIDTARYQASVPMPAIEAMILFVGRLDEEKHVDELVRALTLIPAELGARLEVVGAGSQRASLDALTDRLGLRNRVHFHGLAPERVLLDAYARCAVFCMPGTAELQSLATMEAMAAGKPVVAAHAMALPHLVRQGQNGRLYPPGDVPALAEALAAILRLPPAGREALGATGRRIVAGHELAGTLDAFQTVYRQVCRTVPARPSRVGAARGPR